MFVGSWTSCCTRVWACCKLLQWPDPQEPTARNDPSIIRAELAIASTISSGLHMPFWYNHNDEVTGPVPYDSPRALDFPHTIDPLCDKHMQHYATSLLH